MSSTYNTNEFRAGLKVLIDNSPYVILENEFVKPGKGQAFNRVRMRNLMNSRILERTFKSGESVPAADIVDVEMQLVYHGQGSWQFMNSESFEQMEVTDEQMGEALYWAQDQDICTLTLYNGIPITVVPPIFAIQQIVETDPGLRGDTSGGGGKPAKLEGGATVRVPLFVQQGEFVKVDTRTKEYVSRASKEESK